MENDTKDDVLHILKLEPQDKPIYFVVQGWARLLPNGEFDDESMKYFFEEHKCPSDFIGCEEIIIDGDMDPHGLFSYVKSIEKPVPASYPYSPAELWRPILPEAFEEEVGEPTS